MSTFSGNAITVPRVIARAIVRWRKPALQTAMDAVRENMDGRIMQSRSGTTLKNIESQSKTTTLGFKVATTQPSLIAWMLGSPRKAFFVKPVQARALRWEKGGRVFFSKGHMISAWKFAPKRPVLENAVDRSLPQITKDLGREIETAFREIFPNTRMEFRL